MLSFSSENHYCKNPKKKSCFIKIAIHYWYYSIDKENAEINFA